MIRAFRARPDLWRFLKFLVVGGVNTLFGFAVYAVALRIVGLPPQAALAVAYCLGVVWNYFTHARIVFKTEGYRRLPLYALAYSLLYGVNAGALELLVRAGVAPLWAQAILVLPAAILAFMLLSIVLTGSVPFRNALGRRDR